MNHFDGEANPSSLIQNGGNNGVVLVAVYIDFVGQGGEGVSLLQAVQLLIVVVVAAAMVLTSPLNVRPPARPPLNLMPMSPTQRKGCTQVFTSDLRACYPGYITTRCARLINRPADRSGARRNLLDIRRGERATKTTISGSGGSEIEV